MLCRDGIVFNKDLQKILQVVVDYLYKFAGWVQWDSFLTNIEVGQHRSHCHSILFYVNIDLLLVTHHCKFVFRDPKLVIPEMREGIAVSLVASYPKLAQPLCRPTDKPWVRTLSFIS
jgi:hypothetical protein